MSGAERACVLLLLMAGSGAIAAFAVWFIDGLTR